MFKYIRNDSELDKGSAFDADPLRREYLARTTNSPELLSVYVYDPDTRVRIAVAQNPNTPNNLLEELTQDSDIWVLDTIAGRDNLSEDLILKLVSRIEEFESLCMKYDDNDAWEELGEFVSDIASNSNTPPYILHNISRLYEVCDIIDVSLAANPNTPEEVLRDILTEYSDSIVEALAENPSTPEDVLMEIATDPTYSYSDARYLMAKSKTTPTSVLQVLAKDSDKEVAELVRKNHNFKES